MDKVKRIDLKDDEINALKKKIDSLDDEIRELRDANEKLKLLNNKYSDDMLLELENLKRLLEDKDNKIKSLEEQLALLNE